MALQQAIRDAPGPITSVDMDLDLYAWVRTTPGAPPRRGWMRSNSMALLTFDAEPHGTLTIDHTLFMPEGPLGDSNAELYRLNRPVLAEALARIEASLSPIVEVRGLPGVTPTGFDPA